VRKLEPLQIKAWALPLIVIAIAVPIAAAFAALGPMVGLAVGALAAATIIVLAARARFEEPIEVGSSPAGRYLLLVVIVEPLDDPGLAGQVTQIAGEGARATGAGPEREPELLVLAPALNKPVAHWLSDLRQARYEAQKRLALSVATLAAAGVDARGQVGDSDPVQAVEDVLRTFPAREVVFVGGAERGRAVEDIRRRLDRPVRELTPAAAAARPRVERR
jgi:hypothetical protein